MKLGWPVAKSTIQRYLKGRRAAGPGSQTWRTFLHTHASAIWACDFLQVHDLWFRDIFVFVIIELASRRVVHVAVTRHPGEVWVAQQLREATPFGEGPRYLIRDHDSKYGTAFDRVAAGAGIKVIHTPIAAPRANAVCERFLGSLRRECLDCLFTLSERQLLHHVKEYVQYFNHARPHQGIDQAIPIAAIAPTLPALEGEIVSLPVLHGLHHDYQRRAAWGRGLYRSLPTRQPPQGATSMAPQTGLDRRELPSCRPGLFSPGSTRTVASCGPSAAASLKSVRRSSMRS